MQFLRHQLVHHFLEFSARKLPDKTAVIHDDHRLTFKELNSRANALASWLINSQVGNGSRVILLLENSMEYIIGYYGILKTGATVVPLNTDIKKDQLNFLLDEIDPAAIVSSYRFERLLKMMGFQKRPLTKLAVFKPRLNWSASQLGVIALEDILNTAHHEQNADISIEPDSLASIIYTSGSTGTAKGVMLSHRNIVSNVASISEYLALSKNDIQMVILPFFYVMGKSLLNSHFAVGGSVVINNKVAYPATVIKQMINENVTGLSGVPSTYAYLLYRSPLKKMAQQLKALRYCSQAGGHMSNHLKRELRRVLPDWTQIYIMYGATEAAARLTYLPPQYYEAKLGSIGKAIPNVRLKVLDKKGAALPPGEVGELVANGPNIMKGYFQDPESTARVLRREGYHTGDMGYYDEEGFLYVTGRRDNILKVSGHRINPQEIEDGLLSSGQLAEVAVIGQPDELMGSRLVALATPIDESCWPESLHRFCSEKFPSYKRPASIQFVKHLPKKASGKIDKHKCASLIKHA